MNEKPEKDNDNDDNEKTLNEMINEFKKTHDTENTLSQNGKIAFDGLTRFFQNLSERIKEDDNPDNAYEYIGDSLTEAMYGDQLINEAGPTGTLCRYCDKKAAKLNICCKCKVKLCPKHTQICDKCIGTQCKGIDDELHTGPCQKVSYPTVDCAQQ